MNRKQRNKIKLQSCILNYHDDGAPWPVFAMGEPSKVSKNRRNARIRAFRRRDE